MIPDHKKNGLDYEVMIVGAGIAGMETAALLGDMGYNVLLVEKEPSIGGKSILLSKVFPTLDCASCIVTPKMAAVAHHPKITPMVYTEVDSFIRNDDGSFTVDLHKKASYVNYDACTGCDKCEEICTVSLPDKYNYNLAASRAAHIPFPQAVPKKAVISRKGQAPCNSACPAGVKPSLYLSSVRDATMKHSGCTSRMLPWWAALRVLVMHLVKANAPAGIKMAPCISVRSNASWQTTITQIIPSLNTAVRRCCWTRE
jgi:heterodisulfide reductase subunit A-like polyferredoxin